MVMCFAPTCKHYSTSHTCKFFVFPKDRKELRKWIKLIRRKDREPGKHSRICSCHFINGDRSNGPTIFDFNVAKKFESSEQKSKIKRVKTIEAADSEAGPSGLQRQILGNITNKEESMTSIEVGTTAPSETSAESEVEAETPSEAETPFEVETSAVVDTSSKVETSSEAAQVQFIAMLNAENYFLKDEVNKLKNDIENLSKSFSFRHIENNAHLITVHTGLPSKEIFLALFSLFEHRKLNYFAGWQVVKIPKIDQLLLTLMKLKLNLLNDDLALRFNVSRETVSNVFKTWLFALHEILFEQLMKDIPSRNKNKMCMPTSFSSFTNCRIIVDCTELSTIHPKNMESQRATYSSYKHRNTLKGLVGVAPNGVVTFASKLYPGSTSDKKITEHCGITKQLSAGDLVLADKGFLISDVLPEGVSLNLPPFLTTPQFTAAQVVRTRTIAKARIHVERAIRRIKCYEILSAIPATLMQHASVVFQVCAALTNLHFPLIKEVENLYDY